MLEIKAAFVSLKRAGMRSRYIRHLKKMHLRLVQKTFPEILLIAPYTLSYLLAICPSGRQLPRINERIYRTEDLLDDFDWIDSGFDRFEEVNIVMRGCSLNTDEINKHLPTFFLNPKERADPRIFPDIYYLTADNAILRSLIGDSSDDGYISASKSEQICFIATTAHCSKSLLRSKRCSVTTLKSNIEENVSKMDLPSGRFRLIGSVLHLSRVPNLQLGSGLVAVIALLNVSKKVNIYGWDQYLGSEITGTCRNQIMTLSEKSTSINQIATSLVNYIYAYRIINQKWSRVKVSGLICSASRCDWIQRKAFQVIYKFQDYESSSPKRVDAF